MIRKRVLSLVVILFSIAADALAKGSAIDAKYKAIGAATLGKPSGAEKAASGGGRLRLYANGGIYWSKATGTHAVYGPAFDKYMSVGAEKGKLGYPVTDVLTTADGGTQTLFRHGYILGDKGGAATAQTTPNATFMADSVSFSGGAKAKMANANEALIQGFLPESGAGGQTVTCGCSMGMSLEIGMCAISAAGPNAIRCSKGSCRNSCAITIVKGAS
jgi:hypothetical protein